MSYTVDRLYGKILRVVTINGEDEINEELEMNERVLDQSSFPYRVRDVFLLQYNTGFVYMLISVRSADFVYIGKTTNLIERLRAHNYGYGSSSTEPAHLRPYASAYIYGFNEDNGEISVFST